MLPVLAGLALAAPLAPWGSATSPVPAAGAASFALGHSFSFVAEEAG